MSMARNKKMMTITLPYEVVERLDDWIKKREYPPARNQVIEKSIVKYLDDNDG